MLDTSNAFNGLRKLVMYALATFELKVFPVNNPAAEVETTPVNALPFPLKNSAVILAADVILPVALTTPAVNKLAPTTLPLALTAPTVFRF